MANPKGGRVRENRHVLNSKSREEPGSGSEGKEP